MLGDATETLFANASFGTKQQRKTLAAFIQFQIVADRGGVPAEAFLRKSHQFDIFEGGREVLSPGLIRLVSSRATSITLA